MKTVFGIFLALIFGLAHATGGKIVTQSGSVTATNTLDAFGGSGGEANIGPITNTGPGGATVNTRAYGGGSTALTGNAECLQSVGVAFNAVSFTFRDGDCLAKKAATKFCKDDACRKKIECGDKDLPQYAKDAIGCK